MNEKIKIEYDPDRDELIVEGVRFAGHYFRCIAAAPIGNWLRIEARSDGTVTVFQPSEESMRTFDAIVGKNHPVVTR